MKVVPKIADILELVAGTGEITFSRILDTTGLTRSNVSHLLNALCACDLLERTGHGVYRPGERLSRFSGGEEKCSRLYAIANRCAVSVMRQLNESCTVSLRYHGHRLTVVKRIPEKRIQIISDVQKHAAVDWYGSGNGRLLLAFMDNAEIAEVISQIGLPRSDAWPEATTLPELKQKIAEIRKNGYLSISTADDIGVMAVPARDCTGKSAFCVATSYIIGKCAFPCDKILSALKRAAENMSMEMTLNGISVDCLKLQNENGFDK
jgi:DNA-binding IclR family transcriptional regulator